LKVQHEDTEYAQSDRLRRIAVIDNFRSVMFLSSSVW